MAVRMFFVLFYAFPLSYIIVQSSSSHRRRVKFSPGGGLKWNLLGEFHCVRIISYFMRNKKNKMSLKSRPNTRLFTIQRSTFMYMSVWPRCRVKSSVYCFVEWSLIKVKYVERYRVSSRAFGHPIRRSRAWARAVTAVSGEFDHTSCPNRFFLEKSKWGQ